MEEELKRIEGLIENCNQCKLNACISCDICWSEVQAIENLLKRYKELEEENEMLKKANNISEDVTVEDITQVMNKSLEEFKREFIPISVIQNKIDELKKAIEEEDYEKLEYPIVETDIVISALQELLDERSK